MCTVSEMLARFEQVAEQTTAIAGEAMLENKEPIIGLLINQQVEQNVDSADNELRPYKSQYKALKERYVPGFKGKTDFELTGEFHAEMNLREDGTEYEFNSPALTEKGELKSEWLTNWNGSEIMSLTPENKELVWPIIYDDFVNKVKKILKL